MKKWGINNRWTVIACNRFVSFCIARFATSFWLAEMRVKEMHPLCCITLESAGLDDQSPEISLSRTRSLPASLAKAPLGSDTNASGRPAGSETTVAGVLHKWTNYSKGWRSRWFLLRNGVLSYAKIRRPETLSLLTPNDDVRLIGEISTHRLSRIDSGTGRRNNKPPKTVGIVQLKVNVCTETVRFVFVFAFVIRCDRF